MKQFIPKKIMYFIDGENIVIRYQDMVRKGFEPHSNVIHEPDIFVWSPQISSPGINQLVRAYYYASVTGDTDKMQDIAVKIKRLTLPRQAGDEITKRLYPVVMKKPDNKTKAKGIDIQMTVDILSHVYQNNLDIVCLFSGDGDYKPVLEEAIRYGKQVYVAAFSDGLNPDLKNVADEFIDLDNVFFDLSKSPVYVVGR